jgi:hypothetical protein
VAEGQKDFKKEKYLLTKTKNCDIIYDVAENKSVINRKASKVQAKYA